MNGLLLINKEKGYTSHDVVSQVRKIFNIKQVGHGGTLDPMATGLLVVGLGKGTKVLDYVANNSKEYIAKGEFGYETDTYDQTGRITAECPIPSDIPWNEVMDRFTGEIDQVPPMYSALKRDGKKLYEYAREGIELERKPRKVTIYELSLLKSLGNSFTLKIHCSSGTYIRSLIHDMGEYLKSAATMTELQRVSIGSLQVKDSHSISKLKEMNGEELRSIIIPMDQALTHLPAVELHEKYKNSIIHGKPIDLKYGEQSVGMSRVYCGKDFMGIGMVLMEEQTKVLKIKKMLYQEPEWRL